MAARAPDVLSGFALLLAAQAGGEVVVRVLPLPLPGAVPGIGIALLLACWGRLAAPMQVAARPLLAWLPLFLVPIGVGIVEQGDVLRQEGVAMVATIILSTGLTMVVTHRVFRRVLRHSGG